MNCEEKEEEEEEEEEEKGGEGGGGFFAFIVQCSDGGARAYACLDRDDIKN